MAQVISPCNDAASGPDIVESTEDLQSCFQVFNSLPAEERKGLIVFSMDATALYPSILVQRSSEVVYKLMAETSIVFKSIDDLELQRYAAVVLDHEVLLKYDLLDYVMKRKYSKGRKPGNTATEMSSDWDEETSCWVKADRPLNSDSRQKLLAVTISQEVAYVMRKHLFKFGDKLYNQKEGGSIGSELTGVLGTSRMIVFLRKLRMKCENLGLKVFFSKAFVDDVSFGMRDPGSGYTFSDNTLIWSNEKESQDRTMENDVRVAELIVSIANSLEEEQDIQMTYNCPSRNESGMMPVLDLQVWCQKDLIKFLFYEKPMVSDFVTQKWSGLSWNVKKAALAGEVARRYLNTSPDLVAAGYVCELIDKLRYKMLLSGYSQKEREIIVREGEARYFNIVKQVERGDRPLYRPSQWNREDRALKKKVKEKNWFGSKQSVMFVQATPGEILRKRIEDYSD